MLDAMRSRVVLYIGNFFFSLFATLTVYIVFPYLSSLMPEEYAGLVIAGGAFVAILCFPYLPRLVARYGTQRLALVFAIAEVCALLALVVAPGIISEAFLIALTVALQPFLYYQLDLLLEATVAQEEVTGRVRTLFLTAWNVAALAAPLLMGFLLGTSNDYLWVFVASAVALIPFIMLFGIQDLPEGELQTASTMRETFLCIVRDRDLAAVTFAHLLLYLFYVWTPLYIPIYLHNVLGIPWSTLGWMFSIMLLPYVLVEYPAGWVADRLLGEKELMFGGFVIAGTSLAFIGTLSVNSTPLFILCILVVSRIGAALVESMTEIHFFRRVSERDANSVNIFRGIWPLADFIAPIIGSCLLFLGSYQLLFICTGGCIVVLGVGTTLLIKDSR
jgi:MFS family permease